MRLLPWTGVPVVMLLAASAAGAQTLTPDVTSKIDKV